MGVSSYLFGHGLAAAAPGHGQVALGTKKVARTLGPLGPLDPGTPGPLPGHGQISKWKRPVNGNAIWGGVGCGGMAFCVGVGALVACPY